VQIVAPLLAPVGGRRGVVVCLDRSFSDDGWVSKPGITRTRTYRQRLLSLKTAGKGRPLGSRIVHLLGSLSESSTATVAVTAISAGFLIGALAAPRATPWLAAFEALAAAVTLIMVFALQHTQARQQAAVQRKLDEVLRVLPGTDSRLVHVEDAHESELAALSELHLQVREEAIADHPEGTEHP
jgi:low affinity Fe/Cu permease